MSFFSYGTSKGNAPYHALPIFESIKAYEAIGYKCIELRVDIKLEDKQDNQLVKQFQKERDKFRNENLNLAEDLNYYKAIFDGSWPTSVEILEETLRKSRIIKNHKNEKKNKKIK